MGLWFVFAWLITAWAQEDVELVAKGSDWLFQMGGAVPADWTSLDFADDEWVGGETQIGFGEDDQEKELKPDPYDPFTTLWLRHRFRAESTGALEALVLELLVDDGAVVYLNGTEIHRQNLPLGAIDGNTFALEDIDEHAEHRFTTVRVPTTALVDGDNVLAVEVHQSSLSSDDLSFDLGLTGTDGRVRVLRGPYQQCTTPKETVIRWRTDEKVQGVVTIGTDPNDLDRTLKGPVAFDHEIKVGGLKPETTYYYSVGTDTQVLSSGDDHFVKTAPPIGEARPTRIWVIGDSGTADAGAALVRDAYASHSVGKETDLWLMLGDNAYGDGTDAQYQGAVFDMYAEMLRKSPVWPTIGNHDGHTLEADGMIGPYFDIFTLPMQAEAGGVPTGTEAYYSFDWSNIHFVVLDSYTSQLAAGSPQWVWLEEDLLATEQDWIVAYWHHPPYTKGTHDSDTDFNQMLMRQVALPILEDHGVDLVMSGHSHGYERSMLIDGHYTFSFEFEDAMIVDGGNGRPDEDGAYRKPELGPDPHQGTVYMVNGSSGKFGDGTYDHAVHIVNWSTLGSVVLDVEGDRMDAQFISGIGDVLDSFTIVKGDCPLKDPDANGNGICDSEEGAKGCGCATTGAGSAAPWLVLLLFVFARTAQAHPTFEYRLAQVDASLDRAPCDASLWQKRARILVDEGLHEAALDGLDTAVACDPVDPALAAARGKVLLQLGSTEGLKDLEYAAFHRSSALGDLANARALAGDCDGAADAWARHYDRAHQPTPDAAMAWSHALRCADRGAEALDVLTAAIERIGAVPSLQRERAELLAELGRIDDALGSVDDAIANSRVPLRWLHLKIRILEEAGRSTVDARDELDRAIANLPDNVRRRKAVQRYL